MIPDAYNCYRKLKRSHFHDHAIMIAAHCTMQTILHARDERSLRRRTLERSLRRRTLLQERQRYIWCYLQVSTANKNVFYYCYTKSVVLNGGGENTDC